jgi:hypothetical protein
METGDKYVVIYVEDPQILAKIGDMLPKNCFVIVLTGSCAGSLDG